MFGRSANVYNCPRFYDFANSIVSILLRYDSFRRVTASYYFFAAVISHTMTISFVLYCAILFSTIANLTLTVFEFDTVSSSSYLRSVQNTIHCVVWTYAVSLLFVWATRVTLDDFKSAVRATTCCSDFEAPVSTEDRFRRRRNEDLLSPVFGLALLLISYLRTCILIFRNVYDDFAIVYDVMAAFFATTVAMVGFLVFHFVGMSNGTTGGDRHIFSSSRDRETADGANRRKDTCGTVCNIVFIEGTSCIGKTTVCHRSFDYDYYRKLNPLYIKKQEIPGVKSLYDANLMIDVFDELLDWRDRICQLELETHQLASNDGATLSLFDRCLPNCQSSSNDIYYDEREGFKRSTIRETSAPMLDRIFERVIFSQVVYDILFALKGEVVPPEKFAAAVDELIVLDINYRNEIRRVFKKWMDLARRLVPCANIKMLWCGADNVRKTVEDIKKRGGFENDAPDWNLVNYIANQNYIFKTIAEISGVGRYVTVDKLTGRSVYELCWEDCNAK